METKKLVWLTVAAIVVVLLAGMPAFADAEPADVPMVPTLEWLIMWVTSGIGAGAIAWFLMEKIPALDRLSAEWKRYVALAISGVLAALAFVGGAFLGYLPMPVGAVEWIERLFSVIAVAIITSQTIHGRTRLREARLF